MRGLHLQVLSEMAIRVVLSKTVSHQQQRYVQAGYRKMKKVQHRAVTDIVPDYTGVTVYYQPDQLTYEAMAGWLWSVLADIDVEGSTTQQIIKLPVVYGGTYGEDLKRVAAYHQLHESEVVKIHTGQDYLLHMFGFFPGFPYLGGMSSDIATPRLQTPRLQVAQGSVGIAGDQTGVYPVATPGGWNIIGRTPVSLFSVEDDEPCVGHVGDYIRFYEVTEAEFIELQQAVRQGETVIKKVTQGEE